MSPTRRDRPAERRVGALVRRALGTLACLASAACGAPEQIFSDATDAAARVTRLAWFMIILSAVVYTGVMLTLLLAARRNRARDPVSVDLTRPGPRFVVIGGALMPAAVLLAVFIVMLTAMGAFPERAAPTLTIDLRGHQWWWEAEYDFPSLPQHFLTANELHVPVGQPVRLRLTTQDVIHSFWVPRLHGKLDLIPGDTNEMRLVVREPGTYRGQCAEFCGAEHAKMGIVVVAQSPEAFRVWAGRQLADAAPPADSLALEGQRLFASGPCALCHTVRGTPALGKIAPDLTHVGGRTTIAAGALPNTLGNLEAWIANAQAIKPGAKMPTITQYSGEELRALATYLASLK